MKTMKEVLYIHTYGQGGGRGWELVGLSSLDILTQIFFIVVSSIKMSTLKQKSCHIAQNLNLSS